jgi:hypothetical protein
MFFATDAKQSPACMISASVPTSDAISLVQQLCVIVSMLPLLACMQLQVAGGSLLVAPLVEEVRLYRACAG